MAPRTEIKQMEGRMSRNVCKEALTGDSFLFVWNI